MAHKQGLQVLQNQLLWELYDIRATGLCSMKPLGWPLFDTGMQEVFHSLGTILNLRERLQRCWEAAARHTLGFTFRQTSPLVTTLVFPLSFQVAAPPDVSRRCAFIQRRRVQSWPKWGARRWRNSSLSDRQRLWLGCLRLLIYEIDLRGPAMLWRGLPDGGRLMYEDKRLFRVCNKNGFILNITPAHQTDDVSAG